MCGRCPARLEGVRRTRVRTTAPVHGLRRACGHCTRTLAEPACVADARAVVTAAPMPKATIELPLPVARYTLRPSGLTAAPSTSPSDGKLVQRLSSVAAQETSVSLPVDPSRANTTAERLA